MHRIRLRGPWQKRFGASTDSVQINVPESLPATNEPAATDDVVHYERRFNRPTGLDPATCVLLRIEQWSGTIVDLRINGHSLAIATSTIEADITRYLEPHNRVTLSLHRSPTALPCLDGEVALLIQMR